MSIVVFNFGRMNPFTVGHEKLVNVVDAAAKKLGAEGRVYLSHTQDNKKNPLDHSTKVKFAQAAFGNIIVNSPAKTIIEIMKELEKEGFTDVVFVGGSDRVDDFNKLLNDYNGKEYNFRTIKTLSAGERDPDADGVEGMSASKMREFAQADDLGSFTAGLPAKVKKAAATIMKAVQLGLQPKPKAKKKTKEGVEPDPAGYHPDILATPKYTVVIDTPSDMDWYKIGQHFPNLGKEDPHEYGQSDSDLTITLANREETEKLKAKLARLGLKYKEIGGGFDQPEIHSEATKVKISTDPHELGAWVDDSEQDEPTVDIAIKKIIAVLEPDEEHQTKKGAPQRIARMVAALKKGRDTPPILVRKYKNGYQVLDGHHRFKAYRQAGRDSIPAMIIAAKDITDVSDKVARGEEIKEASKKRKSPWDKMVTAIPRLKGSEERAQAAIAGLKQNAADYQAILDREKKVKEDTVWVNPNLTPQQRDALNKNIDKAIKNKPVDVDAYAKDPRTWVEKLPSGKSTAPMPVLNPKTPSRMPNVDMKQIFNKPQYVTASKDNIKAKPKTQPTGIQFPDGDLWISDHFKERRIKYNVDKKQLANTIVDLVKRHKDELLALGPVDFIVISKAGYHIAFSKWQRADNTYKYVLKTIRTEKLRRSPDQTVIMTEDDLNVHFHDTLNTKLFNSAGQMYPIVRKKLLDIAQDFKDFLGIDLPGLKDITVSGSNAAYTYTPKSDIDLHLVVDLPQADTDNTFRELFDAKKYQYNAQHDYKIRDYDVELYVQNSNEPHVSQGIYSVLNDEWIQEPKPVSGKYDKETTAAKYDQIKNLILMAVSARDYELAGKLRQTIKKYRQVGLHTTGEFGPENLAFKALRANGYIKKLYDLLNDLKDREFSLEQLEEEQINELEMNPSSFAAFAKTPAGAQTRVGFEAEMIVPGMTSGSGYSSDYDSEPNYDMDDRVDTSSLSSLIDDLYSFFRDTTSRRTIEREVEEVNDDILQYMEDEFQNDLSDDDIKAEYKLNSDLSDEDISASMEERDSTYDEVIQTLRDEYFASWDDLDGALKSLGLRNYSDWSNDRGFDWPHYYEPEEDNEIDDDAMREAAAEIKNAVNMPIKSASGYKAFGTREPGIWYLETDPSINASESDGEAGLELVSPPMPIAQALEKLEAVFGWMGGRGAYTDSSTGFHMGVSIPNMENLDHLKLVLFLGDQYILKQFKRDTNSYTKSSLEKMQLGNVPHTVKQMPGLFAQLQKGLDATATKLLSTMLVPRGDRYVSVNIKDHYIEFRSAGGDYLSQLDKIKNTMLRYVRVMGIASDPEEGKQEYAKKLYKLLIEGVDDSEDANTLKWFAMYASGNIPKEELILRIKRAQATRQAKKNPASAAQEPQGKWQRWIVYGTDENGNNVPVTAISARDRQEATRIAFRWGRDNNRVITGLNPEDDDLVDLANIVHRNESKRPTSLKGYIEESARPFEWKKDETKQVLTEMQLACIMGGHEYTGEID